MVRRETFRLVQFCIDSSTTWYFKTLSVLHSSTRSVADSNICLTPRQKVFPVQVLQRGHCEISFCFSVAIGQCATSAQVLCVYICIFSDTSVPSHGVEGRKEKDGREGAEGRRKPFHFILFCYIFSVIY